MPKLCHPLSQITNVARLALSSQNWDRSKPFLAPLILRHWEGAQCWTLEITIGGMPPRDGFKKSRLGDLPPQPEILGGMPLEKNIGGYRTE